MKKSDPVIALIELVILAVFLYFCLKIVIDYPIFISGFLVGCYKDKFVEFIKSFFDYTFQEKE